MKHSTNWENIYSIFRTFCKIPEEDQRGRFRLAVDKLIPALVDARPGPDVESIAFTAHSNEIFPELLKTFTEYSELSNGKDNLPIEAYSALLILTDIVPESNLALKNLCQSNLQKIRERYAIPEDIHVLSISNEIRTEIETRNFEYGSDCEESVGPDVLEKLSIPEDRHWSSTQNVDSNGGPEYSMEETENTEVLANEDDTHIDSYMQQDPLKWTTKNYIIATINIILICFILMMVMKRCFWSSQSNETSEADSAVVELPSYYYNIDDEGI